MNPRVLTALPIYNEAAHIENVLRQVRQFSREILVVDDGSRDATPEILAAQSNLHVLTHEQNLGYGAALRTAFHFAVEREYDVLVTIDCDGQHEPRLIPALAEAIFPDDEPPVDIVSGSRYLQPLESGNRPPADRRRINEQITAQLNELLHLHLTDAFCGFKAYRVSSLPRLRITEPGYAMPLQLWIQAAAEEFRIREFPVPLIYLEEKRSFGGSLDDAQRRMDYYQQVIQREWAAMMCGTTCDSAAV